MEDWGEAGWGEGEKEEGDWAEAGLVAVDSVEVGWEEEAPPDTSTYHLGWCQCNQHYHEDRTPCRWQETHTSSCPDSTSTCTWPSS